MARMAADERLRDRTPMGLAADSAAWETPVQMNPASSYDIMDDATSRADDDQLGALLRRVYVGGRFTDADVAEGVFTPQAVRARGQLLWARGIGGVLIGTVIMVPPESKARRLAAPNEAEMHLLAVDEHCRGHGVGRALVRAAIDSAQRAGYHGMVLWTQPAMLVAHRVYAQAGFSRAPTEDFEHNGRCFEIYRRRFAAG